MICKAAEIILTLSATFKDSADQQSVDVKTDFTFLGHDDLFSQIYMTQPEGQTQVIARAQSISLIHCLFRLVKCKFTEPHYKSAWYTLLSLLIFSTYALSIKREGRNLTKKKKKGNIAVAAVVAFLCGYALKSAVLRYCGYRDSPSECDCECVQWPGFLFLPEQETQWPNLCPSLPSPEPITHTHTGLKGRTWSVSCSAEVC